MTTYMDHYRDFVFTKLSSGKLNDIQVDYLMNCMDSNGDIGACLNDLNLTTEYQSFMTQQLSRQQEADYQTTLIADRIKKCQDDISKHQTQLAALSPKLNSVLHDSNTLDARYKNFPDNPTYLAEKSKLNKTMVELQDAMNPLEATVDTLTTELESLQLAATNN